MDPLVPLPCLMKIDSTFSIYLVLILILVFLSAYFSATETALSSCNRIRIKVKAENGSKSAKLVLKVLEIYDRSLITILIGNNIANILSSTLAAALCLKMFSEFKDTETLSTVVSTVVMTILILFLGEIFPKNIAKNHPEKCSMVVCYPLIFLYFLLYPVIMIFYGLSALVKKCFKADKEEVSITEDEFQTIIETVEEEGGLDEEESDIIQAAVEFGDITVKDVLTPIEKVKAIDIKKTSRRDLLSILKNTNYSRLPVYEKTENNIIGILHVKKYLKNVLKSKNFSARAVIQEALEVKDSYKLDDMVDFFKETKRHMAIVKNKENETIGIVTMEDVIEELIGEQNLIKSKIGGSK